MCVRIIQILHCLNMERCAHPRNYICTIRLQYMHVNLSTFQRHILQVLWSTVYLPFFSSTRRFIITKKGNVYPFLFCFFTFAVPQLTKWMQASWQLSIFKIFPAHTLAFPGRKWAVILSRELSPTLHSFRLLFLLLLLPLFLSFFFFSLCKKALRLIREVRCLV